MGLAALSLTNIAIAIIVFAVLAMVMLMVPEKRPLERRIRDLTADPAHKGKSAQLDINALRRGFGWIYEQLRLDVAQQALANWLAAHNADEAKQHLQFVQAGFRQPRVRVVRHQHPWDSLA